MNGGKQPSFNATVDGDLDPSADCVNHYCRFVRPELERLLFDRTVSNEHLRHVLRLYGDALAEISKAGDTLAAVIADEALYLATK